MKNPPVQQDERKTVRGTTRIPTKSALKASIKAVGISVPVGKSSEGDGRVLLRQRPSQPCGRSLYAAVQNADPRHRFFIQRENFITHLSKNQVLRFNILLKNR